MSEQQQKAKSKLNQYCQQRGISPPEYTTENVGTAHEPIWDVTVTWADQTYTELHLSGSKKDVEQMVAEQALERIEAERQAQLETTKEHSSAFVSGGFAEAFDEVQQQKEEAVEPTSASENKPITVPVEMLTTALGIANHRWGERKRAREKGRQGRPYAGSAETDAQFAAEVAQLAVELVRELHGAAEREGMRWTSKA